MQFSQLVDLALKKFIRMHAPRPCSITSHVLREHSNGKRASLAYIKLTIGSLLACSWSGKSLVDRLS